jgi:hypothetical protein
VTGACLELSFETAAYSDTGNDESGNPLIAETFEALGGLFAALPE